MYFSTFSEIIVSNLLPTPLLFLLTLLIFQLGIEYGTHPCDKGLLISTLLTELELLDIWILKILNNLIVSCASDTVFSQHRKDYLKDLAIFSSRIFTGNPAQPWARG